MLYHSSTKVMMVLLFSRQSQTNFTAKVAQIMMSLAHYSTPFRHGCM